MQLTCEVGRERKERKTERFSFVIQQKTAQQISLVDIWTTAYQYGKTYQITYDHIVIR